MGRLLRFAAMGAVTAALLALAPAGQARSSANLILEVNFDYNGAITVSLPDGTPVGVTGGSPTVLPAGYWTVEVSQPGCVQVPAFIMQGPGVYLQDDLQSGEEVTNADAVTLQPNATYTWRDGSINPPTYHTFVTSGSVVGTPPPPSPVVAGPVSSNREATSDVVGSGISARSAPQLPFRGMLSAVVSAAGKATLSFKGKAVTHLGAGRYTLSVSDLSRTHGFLLERAGSSSAVLKTSPSPSTKSLSVALTAGHWLFAPAPSGTKASFTVTA